jgi:hypothetical protein
MISIAPGPAVEACTVTKAAQTADLLHGDLRAYMITATGAEIVLAEMLLADATALLRRLTAAEKFSEGGK